MEEYSFLEFLKKFDSKDDLIFAYAGLMGLIEHALETKDYNPSKRISIIKEGVNDFKEYRKWLEENK